MRPSSAGAIDVSDPAHEPLTLGLGAFSGHYLVQINLLPAAAILSGAVKG
jgi:hypothetical protein